MARVATRSDEQGAAVQIERADERGGDHRCRSVRSRPAVHSYAALSFLLEGAITVEQGAAGGERWRLGAGDVMLVPAGTPHRVVEKRELVRWSLGFCPACFAAELGSDYASLVAPFERVRAGGAAVVSIAAERRVRFESWLAELEEASRRRDSAGQAVQRSLLTLVLDEIGRASAGPGAPAASARPALAAASLASAAASASPALSMLSASAAPALSAAAAARSGEPNELVAASLRFIELHCLAPLSLGDVAAAVGKSPAHLTTVLRRATGRSAVQWIIAGRMAEARRRLLCGDEPVEHIASKVGYADPTHFIRMFRREHGMTPAAWRRGQP